MKKKLLSLLAALALVTPAAFANSRAGVVTMDFDLSAQPVGEEVRLWIPFPVSNKLQNVTDVSVKGDYQSEGYYTVRSNQTPLLYAQWPKDAKSRKLTLSFKVEREEVRQTNLPTKEPAWNPADYAEFLAPTSLGPTDGAVKELAGKIVAGKKTVLEKARAIYDWTVENTYRDPDTVGCGIGDVCNFLIKPGGKCTDISSVFIALCRAAGVPAREVFGLRLGKTAVQDVTTWQHCWSEFFLPGYGWVTADPADVRKAMLVEKLELDSPRTKELREYFWGGVDAYRFHISEGRDLILNPPQAGAPLNTFGYPYAEVGGKPLDFYSPKTFTYTLTYTESK